MDGGSRANKIYTPVRAEEQASAPSAAPYKILGDRTRENENDRSRETSGKSSKEIMAASRVSTNAYTGWNTPGSSYEAQATKLG